MADDGRAGIIFWLSLLFLSSMGEAYFPDLMKLNETRALTNWMFIGDAVGNMFAVVVPTSKAWSEVAVGKAFVPALCDMCAKAFLLGGIALSSAQTKSILYNSCIVWSAILSRFVLGRILTAKQWCGVGVLIVGFLVKMSSNSKDEFDFSAITGGASTSDDTEGSGTMFIGMISILIGCALHSLTNVVNEFFIRTYGFPPSKLCTLVGCYNLSIWTLFFAIGFILPEKGKDEKGQDDPFKYYTRAYFMEQPALDAKVPNSPMISGVALIGFIFSSTVHAVSYYNLLGSIGVVSCGVMKGLTTAGYVFFSIMLLCGKNGQQWCVSSPVGPTVLASVFCVGGVLFYAMATAEAQQKKEEESNGVEMPVQSASSLSSMQSFSSLSSRPEAARSLTSNTA